MRLLLLLISITALAQVPNDTLLTKLAERDTPQKKFLRDNPGAVETKRLEHAVHYRKANGENVAIFSRGLNWTDGSGQIVPNDPQLWETEAGFRETGTPVVVRIVGGRNSDDIEMYDAVTGKVVTISSPKLRRTGDWTFSLSKWALLDWTLEVTPSGWNLTSQQIAAARGAYSYQLPLASTKADPQPDPATGDLVDGSFRLTRAVMVGADGSRMTCSAWTRAAKSIAFVCDDSTLPAEAFPYQIDPSAAFTSTIGSDDGFIGKTWATWPVPASGNNYQLADNLTYASASDSYDPDLWTYVRHESLFRFDTSSLPDSVVVTSATIAIDVDPISRYDQNGCPFVGAWTNPGIWPIGWDDFYGGPQPTDALSTSMPPTGWSTPSLNNAASGVSKTGYTGLRLGVNCASTPTLRNTVGIYTFESANGPTLTVYYDYPPQTISATPTSGNIIASTWQTVTGTYRDPDGYADINEMRWLGAYAVNGYLACYAWVRRSDGMATLYNDMGDGLLSLYALGSANTVSNSQCDLDLANSSMNCSGTDCSISLRIRFKPTFSYGGYVKHTYTHVYDASWAYGGWTDYGSWTLIPGDPKVIVVSQ